MPIGVGDAAPELRGYRWQDGSTRLVDWNAKGLTLVNFWATWCVPCRDEMPALQALYKRHADEGFEVIGVMQDDAKNDAVAAFLEPLGVAYPVLRPHKRTNMLWGGVNTLPTSFLVDGKGIVVRRYVGASPEQVAGLVLDVESFLQGRPMPPEVIPDKPAIAQPEDKPKEPPPPPPR
ncbi:MAG TPA: TlpA disulfide reductase family protein [Candidatus Polarisedimenticolaceae bacterium]|nr:TlpA disulfide reductase family protein [Candidatus Polarisedimenticolaceae bacterium]